MARGVEQLARTAHARHVEGLVSRGQQLLHPADAGADLGERAALVVPTPVIVFGEPKPGARMMAGDVVLAADARPRLRDARAAAVAGRAALRPSGAQGSAGFGTRLQGRRRQPGRAGQVRLSVTASFAPALDAKADATADLFQVRTQDFPPLAAEVRRFTALATEHGPMAVTGTARFSVTETTQARPLSI